MISFSPLYETIEERGMTMSDLRSFLSSKTIASINKAHLSRNPKTYIGTIEKICLALNVPIEKVVQVLPDSDNMDNN